MGKSPNSCFKIISCGADSADAGHELSPPESKQSSDKRRWSFRKRSARHQVPSNTGISEPQFVGFEKGNPEATTDTFQSMKDSSVPGKTHLVGQPNVTAPVSVAVINSEKSEPLEKVKETEPLTSAVVNSEKPHIVEHTDKTVALSSAVSNTEVIDEPIFAKVTVAIDEHLQENIAIIIQAAARRFLAQRELKKLKHLVKLQAAVRGHLVRRQAIGTLRCVQSIVKMQALVRAYLARQSQSLEECSEQEKHDQKVRRNSILRSNKTNSTVKNLLSNGFARQLLESTLKTKAIHISCDPMRRDSAWQWLERWMAVTSSEIGEEEELNSQGYKGREENTTSAYAELDAAPDPDTSLLSGSKICPRISTGVEGEVDSETNISGKVKFQASAIVSDQCVTFAKDDKESPQSYQNLGTNEEEFTETGSPGAESVHNNYAKYTDFISENPAHTTKCDASPSVEAEGKKFDNGSKKVRNSAFAAVQAKFEELSSAPKATRSSSYGNRDSTVESKLYQSQVDFKPYNFQEDSVTKSEGLNMRENSRQNPMLQVAPSECGTEISISSTLDSPDRSDADGGEIVLEIGLSREENHDVKSGADDSFDLENVKAEVEQLPASSNDLNEKFLEKIDNNLSSSVQFQPVEIVKLVNQLAETTKPEGSPGNHVTAAESNGAPSSEVTKQAKTSKAQNNIPSRKPKSKPVSKTSPSKAKNDSDEKDSIEHSSKDAKNANRRSSFGMAKSDHIDHEPRRSSSNSLPSYMQATESARAKAAHGSSSLKSSPDVHDKENHLKKRHSLPIVDEKQGSSPRVQRSASQTQQINKGINTHSPHSSAERKWQR